VNEQSEDPGRAGAAPPDASTHPTFSSSLGPQSAAANSGADPEVDSGADPEVESASDFAKKKAQLLDALNSKKTQLGEGYTAKKSQLGEGYIAKKSQLGEGYSTTKTQLAERRSDANDKLGTLASERPEVVIGAAFVGGLVIATILKRLAR